MKNCLLSFAVPCYNGERFIQECLDSIFSCSLSEEEYEVICVDDCSRDGSLAILNNNAAAHSNLHVIHHDTNKGWGGARNSCIRNANGKYLWFIDADDYIESSASDELFSCCANNDFDVLAFNYREVSEDHNIILESHIFHNEEVQDGITFVKNVLGKNLVNHAGYVWRFVYRTDYLMKEKMFFPEHVCWEDTVYMPKCILKAHRILSIAAICYNYRRNPLSISSKFHTKYSAELICQMAFCAGRDLLKYADEIPDEQIAEPFRGKAKTMINGFVLNLLRSTQDQRRKFYVIKEEYPVNELKKQMNGLSRLFLLPVIGPMTLSVAAFIYGLKHKRK